MTTLEHVLLARHIAERRRSPNRSLVIDACRLDSAIFCETALWQYDPELEPHDGPMRLYPFQREYIAWLEERYAQQQDGLVEKSRAMWATWGVLAWLLWHWRFEDGFTALIASHNELKTDNFAVDSLFGRLDYMLQRMPAYLKPKRFRRHHLQLLNKDNGSTIQGAAPTAQFARQGRYSVILLDEYAAWEWAVAAETATADASRVRYFVSTPQGANAFKRLRFSGRMPVLTLHWRQHPLKTQAWYDAEKSRRTPENIASELDISYERSVYGRVYPEWEQVKRGDYPYESGWPLYTSWDFGLDGTAMIWWQRNPRTSKWRIIDCYSNSQRTIDYYVPWCTGLVASGLPYAYTEAELAQIEAHSAWPGATHVGDPDVAKRNLETGRSTREILRGHGIHVQSKPGLNSFDTRWQRTKLFLRNIEGINIPACTALDDAIANARFPERREDSQSTSETLLPIHDWTSHYRTAAEYMAVNAPTSATRQLVRPLFAMKNV